MVDEQATTFLSIRHKVVFIGNPTAGKTSLLNRICHDKFQPNYDSTIGVDFFNKTIAYNETIFKIQLWDSAGQEKYKSLIPSYIRGASIIFLIYDLNHHESFESISNWLGFVNQYTKKENVQLVLVGNKKDLERKVTYEEGEKLAKNEDMIFFETSAKTGEGVIEMFYTSFSKIDFFKDIQNKEDIVKDLIEQNVNNEVNIKPYTQNPNLNNNNDLVSKNEFMDKNNKNQNIEENNDSNDKNNNIHLEKPMDDLKKDNKKCGC